MPMKNGIADRLHVYRCSRCGYVTVQVPEVCRSCGQAGRGESIEIPEEGTLYTFTVVYAAPAGVNTPYAIGYVDFDRAIRIFGRIMPCDDLKVEMRVRLARGPFDGKITFCFQPSDAGNEGS